MQILLKTNEPIMKIQTIQYFKPDGQSQVISLGDSINFRPVSKIFPRLAPGNGIHSFCICSSVEDAEANIIMEVYSHFFEVFYEEPRAQARVDGSGRLGLNLTSLEVKPKQGRPAGSINKPREVVTDDPNTYPGIINANRAKAPSSEKIATWSDAQLTRALEWAKDRKKELIKTDGAEVGNKWYRLLFQRVSNEIASRVIA